MHELEEVPTTKVGGNEATADARRGRRLWVLMLIISKPCLQVRPLGLWGHWSKTLNREGLKA